MIRGFTSSGGRLQKVENPMAAFDRLIWIDLLRPTREEETHLEARLGIDIPSLEEMREIEESNRLYVEGHATVMTAVIPWGVSEGTPGMDPVTFVLANGRLITIRYQEPRSIESFSNWAGKIGLDCSNGEATLIGILEMVVNREADILEDCMRRIDDISGSVFRDSTEEVTASRDFQSILTRLGRAGDLITKVRDSLVSLDRLVTFLVQLVVARKGETEKRARLKTIQRDLASLTAHSDSLAQKVTFLLDATLGLVNIEQNSIIKIFSVVAVIFLPPTLVASIYGMNFRVMPELSLPYGYPMALLFMVISAILPYWLFKRKKWL
ncbi:MAG: magnesium transporter CorA family protein [Rhodobacteraceae bacterium]|uniref:magnesium transporter CorA family protein n=1 Tax=Amaricoccus sp. B4 TaxID=3368557 RepID=UPI000DAB7817|nr:magnesium transporter CorA family protein [Paracoccaceae bacterium]